MRPQPDSKIASTAICDKQHVSHPVIHALGVGLCATGGAITGAFLGTVGGPFGMAAGTIGGIVAGSLAGEAAAELLESPGER